MLAALVHLGHGEAADLLDEGEAHVGQGRRTVLAALGLHLGHDMLHAGHLVLVEAERLPHQPVALDQLGRREAQRQPGAVGVVLNEVHDRVEAAVQGAGVGGILAAEVHAAGNVVVARDVNGVLDELVDALVLGGGDGHDGHAQQGLE